MRRNCVRECVRASVPFFFCFLEGVGGEWFAGVVVAKVSTNAEA